jgi:hypothetical protein
MLAVAVVGAYLGCYLALVERCASRDRTVALYSRYDRACQALFAPAHRLDRAIRPAYWAPPACVW